MVLISLIPMAIERVPLNDVDTEDFAANIRKPNEDIKRSFSIDSGNDTYDSTETSKDSAVESSSKDSTCSEEEPDKLTEIQTFSDETLFIQSSEDECMLANKVTSPEEDDYIMPVSPKVVSTEDPAVDRKSLENTVLPNETNTQLMDGHTFQVPVVSDACVDSDCVIVLHNMQKDADHTRRTLTTPEENGCIKPASPQASRPPNTRRVKWPEPPETICDDDLFHVHDLDADLNKYSGVAAPMIAYTQESKVFSSRLELQRAAIALRMNAASQVDRKPLDSTPSAMITMTEDAVESLVTIPEEHGHIKPASPNDNSTQTGDFRKSLKNKNTSRPPNTRRVTWAAQPTIICHCDDEIFPSHRPDLHLDKYCRVASPLIACFGPGDTYITEEEQQERERSFRHIPEEVANKFSSALLARIIAKASPEDANNITNQLSQDKNKYNMKEIREATFEDIHKVFSSQRELLRAAVDINDPSFDKALLRSLHTQFNAARKPQKSKVSRFFSRLGRALVMPFRLYTRGNREGQSHH